ncbi:MAG: Mur ligase family protein, partial [Coriobacteriia bacterium]|nr:Mur ligase family protein [Coriobacteriia bacterium]
ERFADVILGTIEQAEAAIAAGVIEYITEFEILTAAAFTLFAEAEVQFAVLEVGLGGMWDATSIVTPKVAVVTGIDLEHTAILGDTVEEIAVQKAAIIKPGSYAVLGPGVEETRRIFYDRCREVGAEYTIIQPPYVQFDYIGPDYQSINIATAWVAAERALGQAIEPETVQQALDGLVIPGRFEILRDEPFLMIDAAHNPQATRYLCEALVKRYGLIPDENGIDRVPGIDTLLLGILNDKDTRGIIEPLTKLFKNVAVTKSASPRSIPVDELAELVETIDGRRPARYETIAEALADLTVRGVATLATGSITVAGETKAVFTGLL